MLIKGDYGRHLAQAYQSLIDTHKKARNTPSVQLGEHMPSSNTFDVLTTTIQHLAIVESVEAIQTLAAHAARQICGADGAAFVLRDGGFCWYVEEDAIGPLWKGRRFPLESCISGWVMENKQPAAIEDVYNDRRIPVDAYRPTFVKSLVMVPIRTANPIGAIGNYWASRRHPTMDEVRLLQALADCVALAMLRHTPDGRSCDWPPEVTRSRG